MKIKSKVLPIPASNVDTDQIIPARYLTGISKTGLGVHLFEDLPNSPLNEEKYAGAEIILTKENFGCGSSREHAAWSILDKGYKAVIAISLARIFEENCYNNGLVPIKLTEEQVEELFKAQEAGEEFEVDVEKQELNYSINGEAKTINFELDKLKKEFILKGGFLKFLDSKVPEVKTWAQKAGK